GTIELYWIAWIRPRRPFSTRPRSSKSAWAGCIFSIHGPIGGLIRETPNSDWALATDSALAMFMRRAISWLASRVAWSTAARWSSVRLYQVTLDTHGCIIWKYSWMLVQ